MPYYEACAISGFRKRSDDFCNRLCALKLAPSSNRLHTANRFSYRSISDKSNRQKDRLHSQPGKKGLGLTLDSNNNGRGNTGHIILFQALTLEDGKVPTCWPLLQGFKYTDGHGPH